LTDKRGAPDTGAPSFACHFPTQPTEPQAQRFLRSDPVVASNTSGEEGNGPGCSAKKAALAALC